MADAIQDSGTTWTVADLKNSKLLGGVYYSNDRGHMPGGKIDYSYCVRLRDDLCLDMGAGVFGTKGDGVFPQDVYATRYENTLVPNVHVGTTLLLNRTFNLAFLGRAGAASMRGKTITITGTDQAYKEPGLYLEGAVRLIGNIAVHQIFGSAVFLDAGVASFPEAGQENRDAGFMVSSGVILTFGPRNRQREVAAN